MIPLAPSWVETLVGLAAGTYLAPIAIAAVILLGAILLMVGGSALDFGAEVIDTIKHKWRSKW